MKIIYLSTILIFILVSLPAAAQTKFQSGSWSVNQSLEAYSLDKNNGDRSMTLEIEFDKPFKNKPQILLSISQIDADRESNVRYNVTAVSVSKDGFTLKVDTWSDSRIFSISGYWLAITD